MPANAYLLVMTACVDPRGGHYQIERADPLVRLKDYEDAFRFWLAYRDPRLRRILFLENSGYPLDSMRMLAEQANPLGKQVEFVSLNCNSYPPESHYGYAEMTMLDLGLQQSRLRAETTHMIKVTGRLTFPRLRRLLDRVPEDFDFVVDARVWRAPWKKHAVPFMSTQLLLFSHAFYARHIQTRYRDSAPVGRQRWMAESFLYKELTSMPRSGPHARLLRFPCNADPVGQPAHHGRPYGHPRRQVANLIRGAMRKVAPGWWI